MIVNASCFFVLAIGIAICALAVWGICLPQKLVDWALEFLDRSWGIYLAVTLRLLLGLALILVAEESLFPSAFFVLGWIIIAAAIAVAFMGRKRLRRFAHRWFERFSPVGIRVWLSFAIAFGGFLIYGVA